MDQLELFRNLIKMAAVDQKFTDQEVQFLVDRAEAWGIADGQFESTLTDIADGDVKISIPESTEDRTHTLKEMIRLMAADGELADLEKRLCASASARMGFTTEEFGCLLDDVIADEG